MKNKFSWFHLSDLHFRTDDDYERKIVFDSLLEDISKQVKDNVSPNAVFITGDIAFSGHPREYESATQFLHSLSDVCGLSLSNIFCVPGNHDVDWKLITPFFKTATNVFTDRKLLSNLIGNPSEVSLFTQRHHHYNKFIKSVFPWADKHGPSGLSYTLELDIDGLKIGIVGLNSSWLAGPGIDKGQIIVGERQVREALDLTSHPQLLISLLHHPPTYLKEFDESDVKNLLEQRCDFILHGHVHELGALSVASPDSAVFYMAAGASYTERSEILSYNTVSVDLNSGEANVNLRTYSDRISKWVADVATYSSAPDGSFSFQLPERLSKSPQPEVIIIETARDLSLSRTIALSDKPPEPEPELPKIPVPLMNAINSKKCILFAGAGASVDAKLPTWSQLIADLIDNLNEAGALEEGESEELESLMENNDLLVLAPFCLERLGNFEFASFLKEKLDDTKYVSRTHRMLAQIPFRAAVTTNFDTFIEHTREERSKIILPTTMEKLGAPGVEHLLNDSNVFPVIKMHGSYEDIDSLILTHGDFRKVIFQRPKYREFLRRLFTESTLFFYGYSFTDPNVDFVLQEIMSLYEGMSPPHYAVMPDPGKIKRQFLFRNYNIRVIPYKLWHGSHSSAYRILELLSVKNNGAHNK